MYIAHNKVRMNDTDMAGVLYFANQFRFAHEALEDAVESEGLSFKQVFDKEDFVFVIVHCEADLHQKLNVGDHLEIHVSIKSIGSSSFVVDYKIYRDGSELVGTALTTHVALERDTWKKIPIPAKLLPILQKHHI